MEAGNMARAVVTAMVAQNDLLEARQAGKPKDAYVSGDTGRVVHTLSEDVLHDIEVIQVIHCLRF